MKYQVSKFTERKLKEAEALKKAREQERANTNKPFGLYNRSIRGKATSGKAFVTR